MNEIELVKTLTGLTNLDSNIAAFYLNQAERFILDYCGIDALPKQLEGVKIQIAAKMIQENTSNGGTQGSAGQVNGAVGSLSDGNQSVSYSLGNAGNSNFTYDQSTIVTAFGTMLNRYRKLKHDGNICMFENKRCIEGLSEVQVYRTPMVFRPGCR